MPLLQGTGEVAKTLQDFMQVHELLLHACIHVKCAAAARGACVALIVVVSIKLLPSGLRCIAESLPDEREPGAMVDIQYRVAWCDNRTFAIIVIRSQYARDNPMLARNISLVKTRYSKGPILSYLRL